jgi:hypothetical protein
MHFSKSTKVSHARVWSVAAASLVAVSLVAAPAAFAGTLRAKTAPAPSYTFGSLVCTHLGGLVSYSPALSAADAGKSLTVTFHVSTKSCKAKQTTGQSTAAFVTAMTWKVTGSVAAVLPHGTQTASKPGITASGFPLGGSLALTGLPTTSTAFSFSNLNVARASEGHTYLTYPGKAGVASSTANFQGTDFGYSSSASLVLGISLTEMKAMYTNPGITSIRVIGGKLTLQ